jgi:subtilisin family serine protease
MQFLTVQDPSKSADGGSPISFSLTNNTTHTLHLYWIDRSGVEQDYGLIQPNQTRTQGTSSTHVWEVKSDDGSISFKFIPENVYGNIDVKSTGETFTPYAEKSFETANGIWDTYMGYGLINAGKSLGVADIGYALPIGGQNNNLELNVMGAPSAWKAGFTGKGVTVAVLDVGIGAHPEVSGSIIGSYNALTGTSDATPNAGGYDFHPLAVAANIVGVNSPHAGPDVTGIAPDAKLLNVRVGDSITGSPPNAIADGIRWSVDHGAKVLCIPLQSPDTGLQPDYLASAVKYAYDHNVVTVFVGGNFTIYGASGPALLAKAGYCIDVGNFDVTSGLPFASSNLAGDNPFPWVMAASTGYSPTLNGAYSYHLDGGTSYAGPYVAGLAALLFQQNPNATAGDIINKIIAGASSVSSAGAGSSSSAGTVGSASVIGTAGNDVLAKGSGSQSFNGGAGSDTLVYHGSRANFSVTASGTGFQITEKSTGTVDALQNIERIKFDDSSIALDVGQNAVAGSLVRLYQTCFNRAPDLDGLGYWLKQMDNGANLNSVASQFITSTEFKTMYGSSQSDADFVTALYSNVLHRAPDASGLAWHLDVLSKGLDHVSEVINFSESAENITNLVGLTKNGIDFHPYGG